MARLQKVKPIWLLPAVSEVGLRSATERCGDGTLRDSRGCAYRRGAGRTRFEGANRERGDTCAVRASALGRGSSGGAPGGARVSRGGSAGVERPGRTQTEPERAEKHDRR